MGEMHRGALLVGFNFFVQNGIEPLVKMKSLIRGLQRAWMRRKSHTHTQSEKCVVFEAEVKKKLPQAS